MEYSVHKKDLLYPELSFKVSGVLFNVYNTLGAGHKEKHYHKGIEAGFIQEEIKFTHEGMVDLSVYSKKVGKYFPDFIIDGKIVLEIKQGGRLTRSDIEQVLGYLESTGLKLGIWAIFKFYGVKIVRIVNWKVLKNKDNE